MKLPFTMKRHAVIPGVFLTLVCVIGLVRNWSNLEAMAPWTLTQVPRAQMLSVKTTHIEGEQLCKNLPEDVVAFGDSEDASLCCKECAVISSSGVMLHSEFGSEIDKHDCVIRMNNAPTIQYGKDVGTKTTIRVFSHTSVIDVKTMLRSHKFERNNTYFIAWGPERNMLRGRITHNHLKDIKSLFPGINIHVFSQRRMQDADDLFENETGKNRLTSGAYLSTGWFTILLAKEVCESIHVYGFVEEDYCENRTLKALEDAPYHYYQIGPKQCAMYNQHEQAERGGHRYLTEKKIYKKWARQWGNMQFHNPEWDLN